jgi:hypothetical protein
MILSEKSIFGIMLEAGKTDASCAYRKSDSAILVIKAAEHRL